MFAIGVPLDRLFAAIAIETERLHVTRLRSDDASALHAITGSATIQLIDFMREPFTVEGARALIVDDPGRNCFLGIRGRMDGGLIGTIGTHLHGADAIEIGYWLADAAQGFGFAAEALAPVIGALAAAYPDRRIFAECAPANGRSWRLLGRQGFRPTGGEGHRPGRLVLEWSGQHGGYASGGKGDHGAA